MSRTAKVRKTYTISPESAAFLERLRKKRRAPSASSVVEDILQALQRKERRRKLEVETKAYYDSFTDEEVREDAAWADFAMREYAKALEEGGE